MFGTLNINKLKVVAMASAVAVILIPLLAPSLDTVKNLLLSQIYWSYFAASDAKFETASLLVHTSNYILLAAVLLIETAAITSGFLAFRELKNRR